MTIIVELSLQLYSISLKYVDYNLKNYLLKIADISFSIIKIKWHDKKEEEEEKKNLSIYIYVNIRRI